MDCAAALAQLQSSPHGLSDAEAQQRLQRSGANQLRTKPPRALWRKFADQFRSLLVLVLIGAAALAAAVGDSKDAVVILVVIVLNAALGFYQEHRAESTVAALKHMLARHARVRRSGTVMQVAAESLVPGDIVLLEAGDRVSADARVLAAHQAEVAEAALTGESHAVVKHCHALAPGTHALAERLNMVFMNTVVTRGRVEALVTATGMHTEMGRISTLLETAAEQATPLQVQIDTLGKTLATIAGAVVALIFGVGIFRGDDLTQTAMTSIALAVAAIPEGLPAVVTVTLAIGMHRMARNRAIVKKLAAVETLGSTSVICSDKTGTLTLNQMTTRELFFRGRQFNVSGEGYGGAGSITTSDGGALPDFQPLLATAALCNDSSVRDGALIGDPTEGALLALLGKAAARAPGSAATLTAANPRLAEIPFDSAHKFMATFHRDGDRVRMHVKGAPDVLLARAERYLAAAGELPLDSAARERFASENARLAGQAMRVLAVAQREIALADFNAHADLMPWAQQLGLVALVGIIDPPRAEARDAIALCQQAGIQVKMVTGDHAITAAAIARALGLQGAVLTGAQLERIDLAALSRQVEDTAVFARVAPEHKVNIVQALQARGHVVAMTGDGVNDAPALKHANIGIAMGITGTEVTKEAAAMVLADDNFASIVGAVKEGRTIYENIIKFVRFQLSTSVGAILSVFGAQLLALPMPFSAIHILWIALIMDGPPAVMLGLEPSRLGIMNEPPRARHARILTLSRFLRLLVYGTTMAVGTLAVYRHGLQTGSQMYASTLAFTTFVLFQFFNVMNARFEATSAFNRQTFANRKLWLALAAVVVLQVVVVNWPAAQTVFDTEALNLNDWWRATAVASSVLLLEEARKLAVHCGRAMGLAKSAPSAGLER